MSVAGGRPRWGLRGARRELESIEIYPCLGCFGKYHVGGCFRAKPAVFTPICTCAHPAEGIRMEEARHLLEAEIEYIDRMTRHKERKTD